MSADPDTTNDTTSDDFFVGYLPMSKSSARSALGTAAVLLVAVLAMGAAVAWFQTSPGKGLRPYGDEELVGLLRDRPYPHLIHATDDRKLHCVLLVNGGKAGIDLEEAVVDRLVEVRGKRVERDGTHLIEGPTITAAHPNARPGVDLRQPPQSLGEITLEGHIEDSKCYLGRMRPGSGPPHRACAQMCVAGGIPPILVTRDPQGRETHFLLASLDDGPVNEQVLEYLAEPVSVTGMLERRAGLLVLKIAPDGITRL